LPLTINGKINKKALPDPGTRMLLASEDAGPGSELEARLAAIWKDLLELQEVGINDDFFELGGHSLLAIRLISAIRHELKVELTINDVFDHPTIASLARQVKDEPGSGLLPLIQRSEIRPEHIPLSYSQERLWFIDRLEGSVQYHLPEVLRLRGKLNREALEYALQTIINRHEVLRTVIRQEADGRAWQKILDADTWQLEIIDGQNLKEIRGIYSTV
jgi:acyl carrier protein